MRLRLVFTSSGRKKRSGNYSDTSDSDSSRPLPSSPCIRTVCNRNLAKFWKSRLWYGSKIVDVTSQIWIKIYVNTCSSWYLWHVKIQHFIVNCVVLFIGEDNLKKQVSDLIDLRLTWREMGNLIFGWFMKIFGEFWRIFGEFVKIFGEFLRNFGEILENFWQVLEILNFVRKTSNPLNFVRRTSRFQIEVLKSEVLRPLWPPNSLRGQIFNQIWNLWPRLHMLPCLLDCFGLFGPND